MPKSRVTLLILALAVTLLVTALGGVSVHRKVASFQPVGFQAEETGSGTRVVRVLEPGTGLEAGDVILLVDGRQVEDVERSLTRASTRQILVQRGEELIQVDYRRPPLDIDFSYLILTLIGTAYLLVGSYTLLKTRRAPALLFHLWCLTSAALYLCSPAFLYLGISTPDGLDKAIFTVDELARIWIAPLTLHLFLVFPSPLGRGERMRRFLPFLYLPAAAFTVFEIDLAFLGARLVAGSTRAGIALLDAVELYQIVAFAVAVVGVLVVRLVRHRNWEHHRQVQWMTFGLAGGYLPFAAFYVAPHLVGYRSPELLESMAVIPLALVPISFAWAILRFKLWDIEVIVRDTISSTLTLLLGVVGFSLVHLAITRGLPEDLPLARNVLSFGAGLSIAALLVPARRGIASTLERLQYGGTFGRRRALKQFADELLHERDLRKLSHRLIDELEESVPLARVNLYLGQGPSMAPLRDEQAIPAELPFDGLGESVWGHPFTLLSPVSLPTGSMPPEQRLFVAGYRYAFPLKVLDHRVGLIMATYREDGTPLNSDDIELVRQLLDHASLAIENAQLLDQLHHQLDEVIRLQEYNEGIIESSPAGIAVLDEEDRIVSANGAFAAITRTRSSDRSLTGRSLAEVLPVRPLPAPEDGLLEVSYCETSGEEHYLQLSISRFTQGGDQPLRILVVHDVTERVAMEHALQEKDRLAALGMLAAGVAHEVNTPITGISSYAQMLLAETTSEDPHYDLLKKMERQTFQAARIVNNLLELARNKSGERTVFNIVPLIDDTLDLLKERMVRRRIRLHWEPGPEAVEVFGNEGELQQVLTNLVVNGCEAMADDGGILTLGLDCEGDRVRISVEDTGAGIPEERLERIFQPFFSTKLTSGGTGLGLSISHEIVRRHGGDLRVESRPGEGSRFIVELPQRREVSTTG